MINTNELRIGNYILDHKDRIKRVWTIKQNIVMVSDYDIDETEVNPIPLTPEILEKAGFVRINDAWRIEVPNDPYHAIFMVCWNNELNKFYIILYNFMYEVPTVHNLQNKFESITGEELKIEL